MTTLTVQKIREDVADCLGEDDPAEIPSTRTSSTTGSTPCAS